MFEYLPLKAGELTGRLSFSSSELGVYQYDLNLTATPAGTEAPVHFRAGLGTNQSQTCRFVNFAKSKVEYSCKVIRVTLICRFFVVIILIVSQLFWGEKRCVTTQIWLRRRLKQGLLWKALIRARPQKENDWLCLE